MNNMDSYHVGMNTGLAYRRAQTQCHLEGPGRIVLKQRLLESNDIMIGVEKALLLRCHIQYDLKGTQNEICRKPHQLSLVKKVQNKKQCRNANAISTVEGQWHEVDCRSAMKMQCRMALTVPCRRAPKVPCRRAPKVPCRRALKVHCRRALKMHCRRAMKVRYILVA